MNRSELQDLARLRLSEAKALLDAGLPDGAYYLAGYCVECGLKACIAKNTRRYDFPDKRTVDGSYTHNLKDLVKVAKLESFLLERTKADLVFRENWEVVGEWSEKSRYERHDGETAKALVEAVGNLYGVFSWVRYYW